MRCLKPSGSRTTFAQLFQEMRNSSAEGGVSQGFELFCEIDCKMSQGFSVSSHNSGLSRLQISSAEWFQDQFKSRASRVSASGTCASEGRVAYIEPSCPFTSIDWASPRHPAKISRPRQTVPESHFDPQHETALVASDCFVTSILFGVLASLNRVRAVRRS